MSLLLDSQWDELATLARESALDSTKFRMGTLREAIKLNGDSPAIFYGEHDAFAIGEHFKVGAMYDPYPTGKFSVYLSPAEERVEQEIEALPWSGVVMCFRQWLLYVEREDKAEGFFEVLRKAPVPALTEAIRPDEPFSETEAEEIRQRLDKVERWLLAVRPVDTEEAAFIEEEFREMRDDLATTPKRKWILQAVGHFASFLTLYESETIREAMKQVWGVIQGFIANLQLPS